MKHTLKLKHKIKHKNGTARNPFRPLKEYGKKLVIGYDKSNTGDVGIISSFKFIDNTYVLGVEKCY